MDFIKKIYASDKHFAIQWFYHIQSTLFILSVLVPSDLWRYSESAVVMISYYFDHKAEQIAAISSWFAMSESLIL